MTPAELIAEVAAAGLRLELTDAGAVVVKPRERCTPEIIERLRAVKPELIAHLRRERLAELAADRLRQHPELRRAAQMEPDGAGRYLVAVAVRMPDGAATAVLTVATDDGLALLAAFDRACKAPLQ
jgi:hypothetical protein